MSYDKQKVIDWAFSQIGYHEKESNSQLDDFTANSGDQNWNKYAAYLDTLKGFYNGPKNIGPQGAWCDIFVDAGFVICYGREAAQFLLCQPDNSAGAGCMYSAQYFNAKGQFHKSGPQPGDQIFFGSAWNNVWHTGLVVEVGNGTVTTIEGNSGDHVQKRIYPLNSSSIWGYGRPEWGKQTDTPPVVEVPPESAQKPSDDSSVCTVKLPLLQIGDADSGSWGPVHAAQTLLIGLGYDCGNKPLFGTEKADGEFGRMTEKSVGLFQNRHDLSIDGIIGGQTWAALLN